MAESNEDRLLGNVLRNALGKTPQCLSVEALAKLDAAGQAHVAHCAYCRNELAMLLEFEEATPRPEEVASVAWIQNQLERRSALTPRALPSESLWSKISGWLLPSRGWQMIPVAAALLLLVVGGVYLRQGHEALRPVVGEPVWRSQSFAAVAPIGDVAAPPAELQWAAVPGASKYLVRVMEVDRTEIWRSEASGPQVTLPAEVRAQMTAGRTFLWLVTARDSAGSSVSETGLQTFHILATPR